MTRPTKSLALALLSTALLTACASGPLGNFEAVGPSLAEARANAAAERGKSVHWGGLIAGVENRANDSLLEIVEQPLGRSGRPRDVDSSEGRFIVRIDGFVDPVIYAPGKALTVNGRLEGENSGKIGDYDYRFPLVAAERHQLWPERREPSAIYYRDPFYFYGPYGRWRRW